MTDLRELAERVEALEGPNFAIECEIENAVGLAQFDRDPRIGFGDADYTRRTPKNYTASLDAAMSLVPEGWCWTVARYWCDGEPLEPARYYADAGDLPKIASSLLCEGDFFESICATPALALTAAALRAIASEQEKG